MMTTYDRYIRPSYITLRGLNLGVDFIRDNDLQPGGAYSLLIEGLEDAEPEGTLDKSGFIGGLALMYKAYDLADGDKVQVRYDGGVIHLSPPQHKRIHKPEPTTTPAPDQEPGTVFQRQHLKHLHIEPFAFGNLGRWVPQTEADVYMVFGVLSEYTDFRYCCGASQALINKLGYSAATKPDAVLIDRTTDEYLIAEFKMTSKDFALNHEPQDVDVLICWDHNQNDATNLPARVVALRDLLEEAIKNGELTL